MAAMMKRKASAFRLYYGRPGFTLLFELLQCFGHINSSWKDTVSFLKKNKLIDAGLFYKLATIGNNYVEFLNNLSW